MIGTEGLHSNLQILKVSETFISANNLQPARTSECQLALSAWLGHVRPEGRAVWSGDRAVRGHHGGEAEGGGDIQPQAGEAGTEAGEGGPATSQELQVSHH